VSRTKKLRVFENRSKLRSSQEMDKELSALHKIVADILLKVDPKDLLATEALMVQTVTLAGSLARMREYFAGKEKKSGEMYKWEAK